MAENMPPEVGKLTPRERQIYLLINEGKTDTDISIAFQISVETVQTHTRNIRRKLGLQRRDWKHIPSQNDKNDLPTF